MLILNSDIRQVSNVVIVNNQNNSSQLAAKSFLLITIFEGTFRTDLKGLVFSFSFSVSIKLAKGTLNLGSIVFEIKSC